MDALRKPGIRVLIVDDHPVLRNGIAAILGEESGCIVVGEASDGVEAVEKFRQLRPDVTLMDLQMPRMGGVEAIASIRKEFRAARIIVLTTYAGDAQALRALKAGAAGYMLKTSLRKEIVEAIVAVAGGRRYIPAELASEIAMHAGDEMLSDREIEVLRLVAQGRANKMIAWQLSLAEDTIKSHLKSIFLKLDAADRTHAVSLAIRRGIIEP